MEMWKNLYHLIKVFWIDFFDTVRRGTEIHLKAIKVFLVFCIIVSRYT